MAVTKPSSTNFCWRGRSLVTWVVSLSALLLTAAGLAGCTSLRPVYADRPFGFMSTSPDGPGLSAAQPGASANQWQPGPGTALLPAMTIPLPPGQDGLLFHNAMRDRLAPQGLPSVATYELVSQGLTVTRNNGTTVVGQTGQKLHNWTARFRYRMFAVNTDGARRLVFANAVTTQSPFVETTSNFIDDQSAFVAKQAALQALADLLYRDLIMQFSRMQRQL